MTPSMKSCSQSAKIREDRLGLALVLLLLLLEYTALLLLLLLLLPPLPLTSTATTTSTHKYDNKYEASPTAPRPRPAHKRLLQFAAQMQQKLKTACQCEPLSTSNRRPPGLLPRAQLTKFVCIMNIRVYHRGWPWKVFPCFAFFIAPTTAGSLRPLP